MRNPCNEVIFLLVTLNSLELSSQSERARNYKGKSSRGEPSRRKERLGDAPILVGPPLREEHPLLVEPLSVAPPLTEASLRPESTRPEPIRPEPIRLAARRARPSQAGPSSLVINFAHPEPHGELKYRNIDYPAGFQMKQRDGSFIPIPSRKPILSLVTENDYILGVLMQYYPWTFSIFFGIYAEFDGKPHRFKIPADGGKPVVMHPDEEKVFYDYRQFDMQGKRY